MKKTPPPKNPSARLNLSGVQFKYFPPAKGMDAFHELHAIAPKSEAREEGSVLPVLGSYAKVKQPATTHVVGRIQWHPGTGEVNFVRTHPDYRGLGVATTLWDKASKLSADTGIKAPKHSRHRTELGDAWAKSVGGAVPPRAHYEEW